MCKRSSSGPSPPAWSNGLQALKQLVNRHKNKLGEAAGSAPRPTFSRGVNTFWSLSLSPLILDQGCGPALVLWRRNKHQPLQLHLDVCGPEKLERRV